MRTWKIINQLDIFRCALVLSLLPRRSRVASLSKPFRLLCVRLTRFKNLLSKRYFKCTEMRIKTDRHWFCDSCKMVPARKLNSPQYLDLLQLSLQFESLENYEKTSMWWSLSILVVPILHGVSRPDPTAYIWSFRIVNDFLLTRERFLI